MYNSICGHLVAHLEYRNGLYAWNEQRYNPYSTGRL